MLVGLEPAMLMSKPPCDEGIVLGFPATTRGPAIGGRWVLATTILGSSLAFIDGTVVNVALPVIQRQLHGSVADAQWIVESYSLLLSALLLVGGSLGDRWGHKRAFAAGVCLFAMASALCGVSPNIRILIIARGIQGIGAALLM